MKCEHTDRVHEGNTKVGYFHVKLHGSPGILEGFKKTNGRRDTGVHQSELYVSIANQGKMEAGYMLHTDWRC